MKYIPLFLIAFTLFSCGGNSSETDEDVLSTEVDSALINSRVDKAKKVFYSIPSPYETALIFESSGVGFNIGLLNPIDNVSNYSTSTKQALNFGVYGADLSYANIFDQSQQCMFYMNCAKKMADELGITAAFDVETIERIERNLNNRDSLMNIINDSYWIADSHLKENQQDYLSALSIAGGWIEGLYLGSAGLKNEKPSEPIMKAIADQKYAMESLIELMELYDHEETIKLKEKLLVIKASFDKITVSNTSTSVSSNENVAVISGGSSLQYTPEIIFEIAQNIKTLRNEIIE
ncbi:MAG: hypothetical protein KFKLKKLM_01443 [Flavobacteriales bacterium]|nr:hypothetical protein [Flavobacteriales bacterium]